MSQETAVFIGNLRKDCQKRDLVSNLKQLFRQTLGIPVGEGDVEVINKGKNSRYAFVYVQSKNELKRAIDQLETYRKRSQLSFDFSLLVDQNDTLRLGEKYSVSKKRDSSRGVPVVEEQFYTDGMNLGNETRDKEFKEGGGIYKDLRILGDHVDKYMCGFLNSSQQGTLFIGVKDSGEVVGVRIGHETENKIRITIDERIKGFKPTVFPDSYHVNFVPVHYSSGQIKENFKVIKISIDKIENPGCLYEASGQVYVRRDGSVQSLKPNQIQEWAKQFHQRELQKVLEQKDAERNMEINKVSAEKDIEIKKNFCRKRH